MKKIILGVLLAVAVTSIQSCCFSGCPDDIEGDPSFSNSLYEPIFIDRATFEESVSISASRNIEEAGKIYVFGSNLYVNEKRKGFHIFNNENPSNPVNTAFLNVLGATDVSIIDNVLYINQATDLIAVTYDSATNALEVKKRIINTFPSIVSPDGQTAFDIPENSVIIGWQSRLEN